MALLISVHVNEPVPLEPGSVSGISLAFLSYMLTCKMILGYGAFFLSM